jgi:two-component system KDP operon response regulator KdpE
MAVYALFTVRVLPYIRKKNNDLEEANMLAKTKILAISSDPTLMKLLEQELNDGQYEVANTQDTGIGLKEVLNKEHPDFIILDIAMPTLDGIGICLHLRQWTQVPIMMLSTWGAKDGMVRGLNLGSESYLTEPFGIGELKTRINETMKRSTTAQTDPLINMGTSAPNKK